MSRRFPQVILIFNDQLIKVGSVLVTDARFKHAVRSLT